MNILLGPFSRKRNEYLFKVKVSLDILAIFAQLTGILWIIIEIFRVEENASAGKVICAPLALILTSFGWWENYVDRFSCLSKDLYFKFID